MPAQNTPAIKTRIEALLADVPGVRKVVTSPACRLGSEDLPTAVLVTRRGARDGKSADSIEITREYDVLLLVQEACKADDEGEQVAALEAAEAWLDTLPDFFYLRKRLERNDGGVCKATLPMTDSGCILVDYAQKKYGAILFTLPVIVLRTLR